MEERRCKEVRDLFGVEYTTDSVERDDNTYDSRLHRLINNVNGKFFSLPAWFKSGAEINHDRIIDSIDDANVWFYFKTHHMFDKYNWIEAIDALCKKEWINTSEVDDEDSKLFCK